MPYSSDLLNKRVAILTPTEATTFGATTTYERTACVWASVTWTKGMKAMHEGALDAYDVVMVRMRYNAAVTRYCRLEVPSEGKTYQILTLNADRQDNTLQITAQEII